MGLSTHILDTSQGRPAAGIDVVLLQESDGGWNEIGRDSTDADGRCRTLLGARELERATYKLRFEVAPYFSAQSITISCLYPYVEIAFTITDASQHYHIPLLISANGYTTYRGS
ncbi:MAG TPA: hydroxyisourate hydrolase [Acidobacteriaceae bacterium]|nr:hydroxyisourate hydrolase [Acidobacteriaceae bacterium]